MSTSGRPFLKLQNFRQQGETEMKTMKVLQVLKLNRSPHRYSVIVALTGLPRGYSIMVALTGLPNRIQCNSSSNRSP